MGADSGSQFTASSDAQGEGRREWWCSGEGVQASISVRVGGESFRAIVSQTGRQAVVLLLEGLCVSPKDWAFTSLLAETSEEKKNERLVVKKAADDRT